MNKPNGFKSRDEIRDEIKRSVSCTSFLTKSKNSMYVCPYCGSGTHENGTGALKYFEDTNTVHCYVCDEKTKFHDVIDIYMQTKSVDYETAFKELSEMIGQGDYKPVEPTKKEAPKNADIDFTNYYIECKEHIEDPEALEYLKSRGISKETAKFFWVGYDPAADPASVPGAMENEYKPHPEKRVIIPCSRKYYIARAIRKDIDANYKAPNPKGCSPALFGSKCLSLSADGDFIAICEGVFDALTFEECGVHAVSINSTSNTGLIIKAIKEANAYDRKYLICLDNDIPGIKATETIKAELRALQIPFMDVSKELCGDHKDINEAFVSDERLFQEKLEDIQYSFTEKFSPMLKMIRNSMAGAYKTYPTGLDFFDDLIGGGITKQQICLLLARPATGKTTLFVQIAESLARLKQKCIYFSFEMSEEQMNAKTLSYVMAEYEDKQVSALNVLKLPEISEKEAEAIMKAAERYAKETEAYLLYNPPEVGNDLEKIKMYLSKVGAKAKAAGEDAPIVFIDYLHLIRDRGQDKAEALKDLLMFLKENYAVPYNSYVFAISAINRASGDDISLESGRDTSDIEFTADLQISLNYYRIDQELFDEDKKKDSFKKLVGKSGSKKDITKKEWISILQRQNPRKMILRVLKGRWGCLGNWKEVNFDPVSGRFYEWEKAGDDAPFDELDEVETYDWNGEVIPKKRTK